MTNSLPLSFPEGKSFDVVGFGFNTLDHVCLVPGPVGPDAKQQLSGYLQQPGGQVPTALVALQRWGLRTAYVGPMGDDEGGLRQRAALGGEGVDVSGCRLRHHCGSQVSVILVDRVTGARTVLWQRPAGLALGLEELDRERLTSGRFLLMDAADIDTGIAAGRWAREAGTAVMLDVDEPGARTSELLSVTDVVVVSDRFPQKLTGLGDRDQALRRMLEMGPALVVVTLGSGGAVACSRDGLHQVAAFPVSVADTTSAGDVFHAGCLYGLLLGWEVAATLRFASAAAGLECTSVGGRAAIPPLDRVLELARSRA